jgi:hypothetical protein
MFNIRNQRGVGHLSGDVNPNYSDSTLLVASADWVLVELFRIHYQCSLDEAQEIVDTLVQRPLALVFELQERKRVLLPSLSHRDQTLLLLASECPEKVNIDLLLSWIEPANKSRYVNQILRSLHAQRFLEFDDDGGWCIILPPGLGYVESNYGMWLDKLN